MPGEEPIVPRFDPAQLPEAPDFSFEAALWAPGVQRVAGVDEAGRGAFAGPVAAGAVIFPPDPALSTVLQGVRDSKQMTAAERAYWSPRIRQAACAWGVGFASAQEIDALGIVPATRLAALRAIEALEVEPQALLLDYLVLPQLSLPQTSLIKGDARSLSIAAASILAKTTRDAWMVELDGRLPGYGFAEHKGYGTVRHRLALERLGPSPAHRLSFRPVGRLNGLPLFEPEHPD
jgi:ribonuclease HII